MDKAVSENCSNNVRYRKYSFHMYIIDFLKVIWNTHVCKLFSFSGSGFPQTRLFHTTALTICFLTLFCFSSQQLKAQENSSSHSKLRFGLITAPTLNWYKTTNARKIKQNGVKPRFGWGVSLDYHFNQITALNFGLQLDYHGGGLSFIDEALYLYANDEVKSIEDVVYFSNSGDTMRLNERNYNITYITLPISLKMKTKEIGYLTYFAHVGVNTSFKTKATAKDKVTSLSTGNATVIEDINIGDDMKPVRFQLNVGIGAEYNLTGTTSLLVNLRYNYGFSGVLNSLTSKESKYLFQRNLASQKGVPLKQRAVENSIAVVVGVLF